jgi:putative flippase GtrA
VIQRELFRYIMVGGACYVAGLALLYLLTDTLGWHFMVSLALALLIMSIVGWFANRTVTFERSRLSRKQELLRYILVNAASSLITMSLMWMLVSKWGWHYLVASAIVAAGMTMGNFLLHRAWSFSRHTR